MAIEWFAYVGSLLLFLAAYLAAIALAYVDSKFWLMANVSVRLVFVGSGLSAFASLATLSSRSIELSKTPQGLIAGAIGALTMLAILIHAISVGIKNFRNVNPNELKGLLVVIMWVIYFVLPFKTEPNLPSGVPLTVPDPK